MKIYFYPHAYLRDRQLDTIRKSLVDPNYKVINPEIIDNRRGGQVSADKANSRKIQFSLKQKLPLVNFKRWPKAAPKDSVTYVWGGLVLGGRFIVDLDNPWSLTGYNLRAMNLYKSLIKWMLLSKRCIEIRCLSEACRFSLKELFGEAVYNKAKVHYPTEFKPITKDQIVVSECCRFLFVGTQFEIKGGLALVKAFEKVSKQFPNSRLDIITHLPEKFQRFTSDCNGIHVHSAKFSRDEIMKNFMHKADVLILPTYVESFGMVIMEAIANGLAIIATDVYAIKEMIKDNGFLIKPPISVWDEYSPSKYYWDLENIKDHIDSTDTSNFEKELELAMSTFILDPSIRKEARINSLNRFMELKKC